MIFTPPHRGKRFLLVFIIILLGILLRFLVMARGHNYDFESYCIVGNIAGNLRNVYSETTRYNYAPIFMCILGVLFRISQVYSDNWELLFRVLIVTVITLADLGIAAYIAINYSVNKALLFFINPVSIIITGYHNQFDNIAVFFALLSTVFFNNDNRFNKKDIGFLVFFSLSLLTKHIFFLIPLAILLIPNISIKKRLLYSIIPPSVFLLSFIPFALQSKDAFNGVKNNVFLYRSSSNSPLLSIIYTVANIPQNTWFIFFIAIMILVLFKIRLRPFKEIVAVYSIAIVAFSSAVANQYLAIPMAALCILYLKPWLYLYISVVGCYLILEGRGLHLLNLIQEYYAHSLLDKIASRISIYGYQLAVWILFFALMDYYLHNVKANKVDNIP